MKEHPVKLIPNLLSAARLALAPYLFWLLWRREYGAALAVCFVAGVTDGLDGFAARKFSAFSRLGGYLDPIADKVLLSGAFLTLALDGAIERWLAVLVLGRDAAILLFAAGARFCSRRRSEIFLRRFGGRRAPRRRSCSSSFCWRTFPGSWGRCGCFWQSGSRWGSRWGAGFTMRGGRCGRGIGST